jgi:intracellular multiplication protein IcmL
MNKLKKQVKGKKTSSVSTSLELEILTSEKRLEVVVRSHTTLIKISLAFALITLLTVISLCVVIFKLSPTNHYFATTSDGRIVQLTPLDEPLLSLQAVEDFAGRAISNTFTFDYANYKTQITNNINSFTSVAFSQIKENLESQQGIATEAVKNSWAVTTNIMSAPSVPMKGKMPNGRYGWRFIFPVRMSFQSETNVRSSRYTADVIVVRESQKDNPKGIAISKLTLTPYRYDND